MKSKRTRSCRRYQSLPLLILLLALTGCTVTVPPLVTPEPTTVQEPLANTSWQLTAIDDNTAQFGAAGAPVTLTFSGDGQASGDAGCNSYGGGYAIDGDTITFTEIVSTLMACSDAAVMAQEEQYLAALNSATHFALASDQLTIWSDDDTNRLTFTPAPTAGEATATPATPVTPLPTVIPAPTTGNSDDPTSTATRITFASGATSVEINGKIAERATDYYVLQAQQGQIMSVEIISPNRDVLLSVVGADGTPYKRYQNGPPSWTSALPATQDYYLHAVSVGAATAYTLRVWIQPLAVATPVPNTEPERVEFAAGATSAERSGLLPSGPGTLQYVLTANEGQTMTVDATSDGVPLSMTIAEPNGYQMIPEMRRVEGGYAIGAQLTLPATGNYVVTLNKGDHSPSTNYKVTFTIE